MPPKAKAKKNQESKSVEKLEAKTEVKTADDADIQITAGDLTKSTAVDTKANTKRPKKGTEEVKEAPAKKLKKSARNRTNLKDAQLLAMCKELDIDMANIDPNDEDIKAILMAVANEDDDEDEAPPKKDDDDEELSDSEVAKAADDSDDDREESKVAPKKREQKKAKKADAKVEKPTEKAIGGDKPKGVPEKKMMNEKEAYEAVMKYMEQQNRPYSIQNIMDNNHGRIPKKICENVLDRLVKENHLTCKEFGKAKVYLANQDKFPTTSQA
jgi:Icc-related predicted phosphoesterase